MAVRPNTNLDDLLKEIGDYEKRQLVMAFPEGTDSIDGYSWRYVHHGMRNDLTLPDSFEPFKGYDWAQQAKEWIGERYGFLVPLKETVRLKPIPQPFDGELDSLQMPLDFHAAFGYYMEEAMINAARHGNREDPKRKIFFDSYLGEKGIVWSITDQGNGFSVETVIEKFKKGDPTYHSPISQGVGFIDFMHERAPKPVSGLPCEHIFSYNPTGNQWMFLYVFEKNVFRPIGKVETEK